MRIPVNYGEVQIRSDKIVVGPSWISRTIGWVMVAFIAGIVLFLLIIGFEHIEWRQIDIRVVLLVVITGYLSLRFMGGWSDRIVIDGESKTILVTKRWVFVPIRRARLSFGDIKNVQYQEVSDQGLKWKDADMAEIVFVLKNDDILSIASLSYAEPKAGLKTSKDITKRIADLVGCPTLNQTTPADKNRKRNQDAS